MSPKILASVLLALGVSLVVIGIEMKSAQNTLEITTLEPTEVPGTKGRNAAIGAAAGAAGGGLLAAIVGGVGVVMAGTGVGLPAGAALIALSAAVGAGAGAVTGAATGRSDSTELVPITKEVVEPAYETWQWASVLMIGAILLVLAGFEIRKLTIQTKTAAT